MTAALTVDAITEESSLQALLAEWWELWDRAPAATPFQSPAWLLPWAGQFAGANWVVLTLRRDGWLIGILPLFLVDDAHGRRLMPMGAGISDYLDGIFDAEVEGRGAALMLAQITDWQAIDLPQLRPASPLLDAPAPRSWSDERRPTDICPVLPLPAAIPSRMLQNLRYYRRRVERAGIVHGVAEAAEEALRLLEALFILHGARWRRCGTPGVLADERVRQFHRQVVPGLAKLGLLRMHALYRDELAVAVAYMIAAKGRTYDYITGFHPDFAQLGVGTVLLACAIEGAMTEGAREFDFLRGSEAYKYRWGAVDRATYGRRLRAGAEG
jgi:CelD/BcsL family acetyltransferase involved in cellulose biosynthesis